LDKLTNALSWGRKPAAFTKLIELTVVQPPLTNTPVLAKLGFDPRTMPMKPMSVEQCVSEGLNALRENRSRIVPGRLNRFMDAFVPAFVKRTFTVKMLGKALASKSASTNSRGEA
jgi:short-subunit dehydrogenase